MATLQNSNATEQVLTVVEDLQIFYGSPPKNLDNWSEDQESDNPYAMYYVTAAYSTDEGNRPMPVAGPAGTASRRVRLHGGRGQLRIGWEVRRLGKRPVLPGWKIDNSSVLLLEKHINPDTPNLMPDGISLAWRIQGLYVYSLLNLPAEDEELAVPITAIFRTQTEPVTLSTWQFDHRLLNFTTTTLRGGGAGIPVS